MSINLFDNTQLDWRTRQFAAFLDALPFTQDRQWMVAEASLVEVILTPSITQTWVWTANTIVYFRNHRCLVVVDGQSRPRTATGFYDGAAPLFWTTVVPVEFDRAVGVPDITMVPARMRLACGQGRIIRLESEAPIFGALIAPLDPAVIDALDIALVDNQITVYRRPTDSPITTATITVVVGKYELKTQVDFEPYCLPASTRDQFSVSPLYFDLQCQQNQEIRVTGSGPIRYSVNVGGPLDIEVRDNSLWVTRNGRDTNSTVASLTVVRGENSDTVTISMAQTCSLPPIVPKPDCVDGTNPCQWRNPRTSYATLVDAYTLRFRGSPAPLRVPGHLGFDIDVGTIQRSAAQPTMNRGKVYQEFRFTETSPYLDLNTSEGLPVHQFFALVDAQYLKEEPPTFWSFPHVAIGADGRLGTNVLERQDQGPRNRRTIRGFPTPQLNATIMIAVDFDAPGTPVWVGYGGRWLADGDPATSVNPCYKLGQVGTAAYVFCAVFHPSYGPTLEVHLNRCWEYQPPTGYGPATDTAPPLITN